MRTFSLPIDKWDEATVQQVVTDQHAESLTVEFKRDLPFAKPSDKLEVAKDISAMANSAGGWIIYGIDEKPGPNGLKVAGTATPLVAGSTAPPNAAHWLDDVIAGNVTPRPSYRVREFAAAADGTYVVAHVTPSSDDLHMLTDGRYYRRSEQAARRMNEPEVRHAYAQIARHRDQAKTFVAGIVENEMVGPPSEGFLLALVPHTFREVLDPADLKMGDLALAHLDIHYRQHLGVFEHGVEAIIADQYRFRVRREGAISLITPRSEREEGPVWYPLEVLKDILSLLAVARAKWPSLGIVQPATFAIRARLAPKTKASTSHAWMHFRPQTLGPTVSFDIAVQQEQVLNAPLAVAQAVMDRLYQHMGVERCPLFKEDGTLTSEAANHARDELRAMER